MEVNWLWPHQPFLSSPRSFSSDTAVTEGEIYDQAFWDISDADEPYYVRYYAPTQFDRKRLLQCLPDADADHPPWDYIREMISAAGDTTQLTAGEILARLETAMPVSQAVSASQNDYSRWEFAKPLRDKRVAWKTIADQWQKQTGEPVDDNAMKQACDRAKRALRALHVTNRN